jgi:hypothetical protein
MSDPLAFFFFAMVWQMRKLKTAIRTYENDTGKRNLLARRLFNLTLRGGGRTLREFVNEAVTAIVSLLDINSVTSLDLIPLLMTTRALPVAVTAFRNAKDREAKVEALGPLIRAIAENYYSGPAAPVVHWGPSVVNALQWILASEVFKHMQEKARKELKHGAVVAMTETARITQDWIRSRKERLPCWYEVARWLQRYRESEYAPTVSSKKTLKTVKTAVEEQKKFEVYKALLRSQLNKDGRKILDNFIRVSPLHAASRLTASQATTRRNDLKLRSNLRAGHTSHIVADEDLAAAWSRKRGMTVLVPAVVVTSTDNKEWLLYKDPANSAYQLDAAWGEEQLPAIHVTVQKIQIGSMYDCSFTADHVVEIEAAKTAANEADAADLASFDSDFFSWKAGEGIEAYIKRMKTYRLVETPAQPTSGADMAARNETSMKNKAKLLQSLSQVGADILK